MGESEAEAHRAGYLGNRAGEDKKRLVGMLIPERALQELLAELQSPLNAPAQQSQDE